ncbi:uncharacterized protein Dwil_GK28242 [Drosophila willistoni]|uniref:Small ribosomal subunit protein RACK1 n=1 Tax=Drosophila willistoni TaxID=7260 RepID=A0A0Q9WWA0_DROWI|nr:uncharacterized protein Dwil_GK28242 [Drosophila willistoni]
MDEQISNENEQYVTFNDSAASNAVNAVDLECQNVTLNAPGGQGQNRPKKPVKLPLRGVAKGKGKPKAWKPRAFKPNAKRVPFNIQEDGHTYWVSCVRFSPNHSNPIIVGSLCTSGGKDSKALLWDLNDGKKLYTLEHNDIINALCFTPNRYWLCVANGPPSRSGTWHARRPLRNCALSSTLIRFPGE